VKAFVFAGSRFSFLFAMRNTYFYSSESVETSTGDRILQHKGLRGRIGIHMCPAETVKVWTARATWVCQVWKQYLLEAAIQRIGYVTANNSMQYHSPSGGNVMEWSSPCPLCWVRCQVNPLE
jgi:hypothetical protein